MRFLRFVLMVLAFSVVAASCKKDKAVNYTVEKSARTDSSINSGNFLVSKGTLTVTVGDSTYTFNAATDSIAFINVDIDSSKYFGITAINKQHTMSFGISSPGFAGSESVNPIAGSQLLFSDKNNSLYALSRHNAAAGYNQITLDEYMKDSVITRGSFDAIMINKSGSDSSIVKAKGYFDLHK